MNTFIHFFKSTVVATGLPTVASVTSTVSSHVTEQCQNGVRLLGSLTRRVGIFKQILFCPDYYDPYVRREHAAYLRINGIDEPAEAAQTIVKAPRRTVAASLVGGMVRWLSLGTTKIFTGYQHRRVVNSFDNAVQAADEKKAAHQRIHAWFASFVRVPVRSCLTEHYQNGARFLTSLPRRVGSFKQILLCPDYYDPYVRREHAEYLRINGIDDPSEIAQNITKAPRRTMAASLVGNMVHCLSLCTTKIFTGYDHQLVVNSFEEAVQAADEKKAAYQERRAWLASFVRVPTSWQFPIQEACERFRRIFPPKQYQEEDEDDLLNARFFPPLAMEAYRQAIKDEKNSWGLVINGDLNVHFIQPFAPPIFPPPAKPKRAHAQ
ncbi:hypothetical protein BX666DRAFT_1890662 [Dichotomocladium elegans]|nr:hypothetical protein BX666DRAFT_1890662 [Dichotomocladium elegans]